MNKLVCNLCVTTKPIEEFAKGNSRYGTQYTCKECSNNRRAEHYKLNHFHEVIRQLRRRCIKSGTVCTLTEKDLPPVPVKCPILNIKLEINSGGSGYNSPTLDKLDPFKGYVAGNVAWISAKANLLKSDNTLETLDRITNYLKGLGHNKKPDGSFMMEYLK